MPSFVACNIDSKEYKLLSLKGLGHAPDPFLLAVLYDMTDVWLPTAITIHISVQIYNIAFFVCVNKW